MPCLPGINPSRTWKLIFGCGSGGSLIRTEKHDSRNYLQNRRTITALTKKTKALDVMLFPEASLTPIITAPTNYHPHSYLFHTSNHPRDGY